MNKTWEFVSKAWNHELFSIKGHSLTAEELAAAAIVFFIGFFLAHIVRKHIAKALSQKTKLSTHYILLISKIIRYSIITFTTFIVLEIIHIPLTSFAFLGGCLAVGLGFGIKNLINNLVSGFILMGERPIKVGDVVEIEGVIGVVEEIGIRSTKIHTEDNIYIIFPNSKLMEEKLINWSYHNRQILTFVEVGIAYQSDVEKATRLMIEAINKNDAILPEPKPFVLFWNYADSTLVFHAYFSMNAHNKMERWTMESRMRYYIYETLTAAGIVFAFPQRDVHFDVSSPIPVTIQNAENGGK